MIRDLVDTDLAKNLIEGLIRKKRKSPNGAPSLAGRREIRLEVLFRRFELGVPILLIGHRDERHPSSSHQRTVRFYRCGRVPSLHHHPGRQGRAGDKPLFPNENPRIPFPPTLGLWQRLQLPLFSVSSDCLRSASRSRVSIPSSSGASVGTGPRLGSMAPTSYPSSSGLRSSFELISHIHGSEHEALPDGRRLGPGVDRVKIRGSSLSRRKNWRGQTRNRL
jgi:hypothetical protein